MEYALPLCHGNSRRRAYMLHCNQRVSLKAVCTEFEVHRPSRSEDIAHLLYDH